MALQQARHAGRRKVRAFHEVKYKRRVRGQVILFYLPGVRGFMGSGEELRFYGGRLHWQLVADHYPGLARYIEPGLW